MDPYVHTKFQRDRPSGCQDIANGFWGDCARGTCARADASHFWLAHTPQLMGHYVRTKFEHDPLSGCRDIARGFLGVCARVTCARADAPHVCLFQIA